MTDNFSLGLIGAMDSLWFHQTVLFPEPFSLPPLKTLKPQQPYSESTTPTTTSPSSSQSASSLAEDHDNISRSLCSLPHHDPLTPEVQDDSKNQEEEMEKRVRRGSVSSRNRSHSSSPSTQKRQRNHRHSTPRSLGSTRMQKTRSCRSLKDLELEEVKGFMDLGFTFRKEYIDSRMINVVPGLLRLNNDNDDDSTEQEEEEITGVMRPYLSEAWLIKRPDSPLLNLKIPKLSAESDMKKHLKCWAQTVAYVVHQEC